MPGDTATQHEERILRLENNLSDISTSVASTVTKLDYVCKQIDEIPERLTEKLELLIPPIAQKVELAAVATKEAVHRIENHGVRLLKIEDQNEARTTFHKHLRTAITAILVGVTSIFLKEFVVLLLHRQ